MSNDIIHQCNELRREIWQLNDDLAYMLAPAPEFRNRKRIDEIECEIMEKERQIEELRRALR